MREVSIKFISKKISIFLLLIACCLLHVSSFAQQRHKIAILTPLYLDSAFDASGNFRFNDKNYARFVNPGLDFYVGAEMALDSLRKRGASLEVHVIDTRSRKGLSNQLNSAELSNVELIIAQSNAAETKAIADFAERKKVPFVSATLPNDAGVGTNPYFVVLNTTLQSHVEGIYKYLQKYHSLDNIVLFTQSGTQEGQIKEYFTDFGKTTNSVPLKFQVVDVANVTNPARYLDSTKKTVCIVGSMDEDFGTSLAAELGTFRKTYPITLIGMPNWSNLNFTKAELKEMEVVYTTPFWYSRTATPLANKLTAEYNNRMSTSPGDMFYRGYETTLRFAMLLLDTKKDIASNLTRKGNTVFTQFDIQPVFKDRNNMTLDYFENKKLYFVRVMGGVKNLLY